MRETMTIKEALQKLSANGFKAFSAHTGGGTYTIYVNKDGDAPFLIGPIVQFDENDQLVLSTDELYWGVDEEFISTPSGTPQVNGSQEGDSADDALLSAMSDYELMLSTRTVRSLSGADLHVHSKDSEVFNELLPSQLK